jgi:hypothetical protein
MKKTARTGRTESSKRATGRSSPAARQAAEKIAAILEEHLDTLPAADKAAKLRAFHDSVSESFAGPATRAKRSKTAAPVFSRVAAQR